MQDMGHGPGRLTRGSLNTDTDTQGTTAITATVGPRYKDGHPLTFTHTHGELTVL